MYLGLLYKCYLCFGSGILIGSQAFLCFVERVKKVVCHFFSCQMTHCEQLSNIVLLKQIAKIKSPLSGTNLLKNYKTKNCIPSTVV
jgi:hypothetical protein